MSRKAGRAVALLSSRSRVTWRKNLEIMWLKVDCMCGWTIVLMANAQVSPNIACAVDR
jgi:hypothetical protein